MSRFVEPGLSSRLLAQASDCPSDVADLTLARLLFTCPFDSGPDPEAIRRGEGLTSQAHAPGQLIRTQLMPFDGTRRIHGLLRIRVENQPISTTFAVATATASGGKFDYLGVREKIQTAEANLRIELGTAPDEHHTHRRRSFFRNFVILHRKCGRWVSFSNTPPWYSRIQERKNSRWDSEYGNHHKALNVSRPMAGRLM